ncbi:MAG TPA: hypothetical protein VHC70_09785, partial [Phycisphaerales bacterium]|nr:hypothetical protein [Phycisphaerales bacterium]
MTCVAITEPATAQNKAQSPVATERVVSVEGMLPGGSDPVNAQGFFLDANGTLVTAWHVAAQFRTLWVNLGCDGVFPVDSVLAEDEALDV